MDAGFPVAIRRAMATAAERSAVREFQFAFVLRLEEFEVGFVVAIEAVVVSFVAAVMHHDVGMLLGNDEILIGVEAQRGGLPLS